MKNGLTIKKVSIYIPIIAAVGLFVLLIAVGIRDDVDVMQARAESGITYIKDLSETEIVDDAAPIGVKKEYTFTLGEIPDGISLAFYAVHQYVDVFLDEENVYSLKPSGEHRITKTTGSSYVIVPLYEQDAGKKVRIEITPVYESFRNRKMEFFMGSSLEIYRTRLIKDLPEIILSIVAMLTGIIFLGMAVYCLIKKRPGKRIAALGLFSLMTGLWRINDTRFTPFMDGGHPVSSYYMAIIMPMLGMLPLVEWLKDAFSENGKRILGFYQTVVSVLCILQMFLQLFVGLDLRETMTATHISMGLGAALIVGLVLYEHIRKVHGGKLPFEIKLAFICVGGVVADVIAFYIKGNSSGLLFTLLTFVVYVICMGIHTMLQYGRQQMQIAKMDMELAKKERSLTDSRIKLMMSQIRTHFIFNVMTTISTYCKIDPQKADTALIRFSKYLRRNIRFIENDGLINFSTELEQLEDYIALEQLRFEDKVVFKKDIRVRSFQLPPLTIQPIVENAIKHGLVEHGRSGTILLGTDMSDGVIEITVKDDGVGFAPEKLENTQSVGIRNVRYRIETMVGGTLDIESEPEKGTTVTIRIPQV